MNEWSVATKDQRLNSFYRDWRFLSNNSKNNNNKHPVFFRFSTIFTLTSYGYFKIIYLLFGWVILVQRGDPLEIFTFHDCLLPLRAPSATIAAAPFQLLPGLKRTAVPFVLLLSFHLGFLLETRNCFPVSCSTNITDLLCFWAYSFPLLTSTTARHLDYLTLKATVYKLILPLIVLLLNFSTVLYFSIPDCSWVLLFF